MKFSDKVKSGSTIKLKIRYVLIHALKPYPETIGLGEDQLVLYYGNVYFASPYVTKVQQTHFKYGNGRLESYTEEVKVCLAHPLDRSV